MDWTEAGIWLVGLGSLLIALGVGLALPRSTFGGWGFSGQLGWRNRGAIGLELAGVLNAGVGGIVLAAVEFTEWWIAISSVVVAAVVVYAFMVWKQHEYRVDWRRQDNPAIDPDDERWRRACRERAATWRWAFLHPFDDAPWPKDCYRLPGAPPRPD